MIKNKWLWTGLVVCACIAAAVAVRPGATKFQSNDINSMSITNDVNGDVAANSASAALNKAAGKVSGSFAAPRMISAAEMESIASFRPIVTEADKQAAMAANRSVSRDPRTPSLDQGSDNCAGVPDLGSVIGSAVATGTTVGATNNLDTTGWGGAVPACWQGTAFSVSTLGPDVYYKWTAPTTSTFTFSLCAGSANGNTYDTGITLWNFTCPAEPTYPANFICGNDDGGLCEANFGSQLTCIPLIQGQQVLIVIDGYDVDAGTYSLDIVDCGACEFPACPPGATLEGEPDCGAEYVDTYNGGCNSTPPVYQNITCGQTICAESGTYTVGGVDRRDTDWYRLVLTDTTLVTAFAVAEFPLVNFVLVPGPTGFTCDSLGVVGGPFNAAPCDTLSVSGCLPPGEYWFFYGPQSFTGIGCGVRYTAWWTCAPCAIDTGCVDGTLNVTCPAGGSFTGNTIGAGNDCWVSGTTQNDTLSEEQIIEVTIPANGLYKFSLCGGSTWDSYIFVTTGCCSGTILNDFANDDDRCGTVGGPSETTCLNLTAGTYYVIVEGWQQTDGGAYTLTVTCCAACDVTCADNETEIDCSNGFVGTNDGCNLAVPAFEPITCGTTKCGSSGNYQINDTTNGRDLDWYTLTVTDTTLITWTWTAEFNARGWILNSDCSALVTLATDTAAACSTKTISACLRQGTYLLLVGPTQFTGTACGSQYTASVTCQPCVIPPSLVTCSDDAINSQPAHLQTEAWGLLASDSRWGTGVANKIFDNFTLQAGEVVGGVTFWGGHVAAGFANCTTENTMTFEIAFWADSSNRTPDFSTGPLCRDTVVLASTESGQIYHSTLQIHGKIYTYTYPEGQCCSLATGVQHWISIQAVSLGAPDCRFMSLSSATGDLSINPFSGANNARSLVYTNGTLTITGVDSLRHRSFCLDPCPVPCNPVTNLTVYNAPGNGAPWLNFTAPQAGIYQIYSTLNPNADDNPDNGADTDYTLEASVFFASGPAQWTAAAGFANYKKYVVIANCQ